MISFLKKIVNKFRYAFCGLWDGMTHDSSISLQCVLGSIVILVCLFLPLSLIEWSIILILIGLVIALEFLNSAIEEIVDFISPQRCNEAKKIKDFSAASVLVISITASIVASIIIGGKFI